MVGLIVKWFPDKRGFATGLVAAGYGMGAIATTLPISASLAPAGYQHTMLMYGLMIGIVGLLAAQALERPPAAWMASYRQSATANTDTSLRQMLKTPVFWLMFLMMSTSGLMVIRWY